MMQSIYQIFAVECSGIRTNGRTFCTNLPKVADPNAGVHTIVSIFLGILAAVAVLIIVIAGLNFVTASGDPAKIARARTTIIYALVGLAVAISAEAIVSLVLGRL